MVTFNRLGMWTALSEMLRSWSIWNNMMISFQRESDSWSKLPQTCCPLTLVCGDVDSGAGSGELVWQLSSLKMLMWRSDSSCDQVPFITVSPTWVPHHVVQACVKILMSGSRRATGFARLISSRSHLLHNLFQDRNHGI